MNHYVHRSDYFYGNKVSDYGIEHGYVDYGTLAKSFDMIINNDIMGKTPELGCWEPVNGCEVLYEDEDGNTISEEEYQELPEEDQEKCFEKYDEVFQWFIISDRGAEILSELTNEIVYYNEYLDLYLWGVTHYGTSWDYVLTDIRIEKEES